MGVRTILKWTSISVGGAAGLILIGVVMIYLLIGFDLSRTFDVEGTSVFIPNDYASASEGARLARLRGCNGGCHGETVNGAVFFDAPDGSVVVAPDLARTVQDYSNEELERLIRHGIRPNGTSVITVMPSSMFFYLSDGDLGKIIAFLNSEATGDVQLPDTKVGPLGRLMFFYYKHLLGTILAAEEIDHGLPRLEPTVEESAEYGRYLAMTVCTECHGNDLRGGPDGFSPSLAVVVAYSVEDFRKLMREGEPVGGRELDLMAEVARNRFSHFTNSEIKSLHAYLRTFASAE